MTPATQAADARTEPRTSNLDRPTLMGLAATEYQQFVTMLGGLNADDWTRPTECPGWDVRAMTSHVLGMAAMAASIREGVRQQRAAKRRSEAFIDALTAVQVEERAGLTPQQLVDQLRVVGPRAARARRRTPALILRRRMPIPQAVGGQEEIWTIGYLVDTILTRDPWMHRIDITRATNHPLEMTAGHDDVLVADVVTEWAARHRQPCHLQLTGAAGGTWTFGVGGPSIDLDAIEFCRTVSGREPGTGLLSTQVAF